MLAQVHAHLPEDRLEQAMAKAWWTSTASWERHQRVRSGLGTFRGQSFGEQRPPRQRLVRQAVDVHLQGRPPVPVVYKD